MKKTLIAALWLLFSAAPAFAAPLPVVASFSILGDMVKTIGGEDVTVTTLAGPDSDTHAYQPTPSDARAMKDAKVIFLNGLGFEGWMDRLVQSSGTAAPRIVTTKGIKVRDMKESGAEDHHEHHDHTHGNIDPHAWQNLANAHVYVKNITDALVAALPDRAEAIRARARAYDAQITKTDMWVRDQFRNIPQDSRFIITSHDAFGYFADAYGITIDAPEGLSTESEPGARQVARLIDQIRAHKVKSVFIENMASPRLMQEIAAQTGAQAGQTLYSDALSKADGPAPTYLSVFRHNVPLMAAAMRH